MKNMYLEQLILNNKYKFSSTDLIIADYFAKHSDDLINKTIAQLSQEILVSETSIFKFVKKLDFDGFQQFKLSVATNLPNKKSSTPAYLMADNEEIFETDSALDIAKKVVHTNISSLASMLPSLEGMQFQEAINIIDTSHSIQFFGMGGSSIIALDSYHKFLRTKYTCVYNPDYHIQLSIASKLDNADCAILFSHSGSTTETINLAKILRKNGVKIISLTGNPNSELNKLSDACIIINSKESLFRTESLTSRILYLTVIDIIYINLMYMDIETNLNSINHIRQSLNTTKKITK